MRILLFYNKYITGLSFLLRISFAACHVLVSCFSFFFFILKCFLISLIISFLIYWLFKSVLFAFHILMNLSISFIYWFLASFHCCRRKYFIWFQSFKICLNLYCGLAYGLAEKYLKCVWEKYVFCYCWVKYFIHILLDLIGLCFFKSPISRLICLDVVSELEYGRLSESKQKDHSAFLLNYSNLFLY